MTKTERAALLALAEDASRLAHGATTPKGVRIPEEQLRGGFERAYRDWQQVRDALWQRKLKKMKRQRGIT